MVIDQWCRLWRSYVRRMTSEKDVIFECAIYADFLVQRRGLTNDDTLANTVRFIDLPIARRVCNL
jgi:hypothetical protein